MSLSATLDRVHLQVRQNRWLWYFTVFTRVALAAGFLPSGFVKIMGERFTDLSVNHPMGNYLEALHHTGYYYTFIGVLQMTAALLLLTPRMATIGAMLYFPIILNICILTFSVRFVGSALTSPLMVLANLYLLCWDYDKLKYILPFHHKTTPEGQPRHQLIRRNFPVYFFAGVFVTMLLVGFASTHAYDIQPYNTLKDCTRRCAGSSKSKACYEFCDCIHSKGQPINKCLDAYNKAPDDAKL